MLLIEEENVSTVQLCQHAHAQVLRADLAKYQTEETGFLGQSGSFC